MNCLFCNKPTNLNKIYLYDELKRHIEQIHCLNCKVFFTHLSRNIFTIETKSYLPSKIMVDLELPNTFIYYELIKGFGMKTIHNTLFTTIIIDPSMDKIVKKYNDYQILK